MFMLQNQYFSKLQAILNLIKLFTHKICKTNNASILMAALYLFSFNTTVLELRKEIM